MSEKPECTKRDSNPQPLDQEVSVLPPCTHQLEVIFFRKMESRDLRRWTIADEDTDGKLNKLEFRNFLHPEEADHMKDIVVQVQQGSLRLL